MVSPAVLALLLLFVDEVDAKGRFFGPASTSRQYFVTLNSARFLYYSDGYVGAQAAPVANYVTARAEIHINASTPLPVYTPAYVPSQVEEEIRRSIWAALPARRECTVTLRDIVIPAVVRTQVVLKILAPPACGPPVDDVDNAITEVFGPVDREVTTGSLRLSENNAGMQQELCVAGFVNCERSPHFCAYGTCGKGACRYGNGDYICACETQRDPDTNIVTVASGVRCNKMDTSCQCTTGGTCSVSGCTCLQPYINVSGTGCEFRNPCTELRPCASGECVTTVHGRFACLCSPGWAGIRCDLLSPGAVVAGLLMLSCVIGVTMRAVSKCRQPANAQPYSVVFSNEQ